MKINSETRNQIEQIFPFLCKSDDFNELFFHSATIINAPKNHNVIRQGDACENLSLILEGTVRVYKIGENGREITLYRIGAGESCILTASCILSDVQSPALAVTETEVKAVIVTASMVRQWMEACSPWRNFIFDLISKRLTDVISVIEEVAFRRMDSRLAIWILENSVKNNKVHTTHQHIAEELGTAREVISRILKDFMEQGALHLTRGEITVIDRDILEIRANQ